MSFGFGLSDFVAVSTFAWQVYTCLKDAPEEHKTLLEDVISLHEVLTQVEGKVEKQKDSLVGREWTQLQDISRKCKEALEDIRSMLRKYQMEGRSKAWSRVKFAGKDTAPIRTRIAAQVDRLNTFNGLLLLSAQTRTERKIDRIIATLKHRGSVISIENVATVMDEDYGWKEFGQALQDQGITLQMVQERHESFVGLLADAVTRVNGEGNTTDREGSPTECDPLSFTSGRGLDPFEDPATEVQKDFIKFAPNTLGNIRESLTYEISQTTKGVKSGNTKANPRSSQQRKSTSSILPSSIAREEEISSEAQRRGCLRLGASICKVAKSPRIGASKRESALDNMKMLYTPLQFKNLNRLLRAVCRGEDDTISRLELIASKDDAETRGQLMASRFASFFGCLEILIILLSTESSDIETRFEDTCIADFENILCNDIDISNRSRQQWPPSTSPSDALKAASCVIAFWHDRGLCDVMQTAFRKPRSAVSGNNKKSRQRQIAGDSSGQALILKAPQICACCSSLLTPMVASIVDERALDEGLTLPEELFRSSDPAAVKMVMNAYTRLILKDLLGHGGNIIRDREIWKNATELGMM